MCIRDRVRYQLSHLPSGEVGPGAGRACIQGKPFVTPIARCYSRPGIWDCPITRQPGSSPRARVTPMSYGPLRRRSASARSPIVGGRDGPPRRTFRFADIARGWLVQDSDETRLGTVVSSGETLLTVSRGLLWSKLYLPVGVGNPDSITR